MKPQWEKKRLGDWAAAVSTGPFGSVLHKSDYVDDGVPLVNPINIVGERIVPDPTKLIGEATRRRLAGYVLQDGDIVVGRRGEIGRCAVVGTREAGWVCGTGSFFIRPSRAMDPHFLAHLIRSSEYRERLERSATGTTMKNLSNTALADLEVPLPPLPEQQRIVAILDEAFDGIATAKANAEKNLQNARALFESHLESVFAKAWESCELVTLSDVSAGITDGDHMPPPKSATGVPFITIGDIAKDTRTIDFADTFKVPRAYFDALREIKKPRRGDLLYSVTGSLGIPVLVDGDVEFCFQRHIGLIRPTPTTDSSWLYYLLLSPQVRRQATERATGTAQKTVSLKALRGFTVPDVPLLQQRTAAVEFDALSARSQHLESIYQQKLAALDDLKKSLLHQAFSGHL